MNNSDRIVVIHQPDFMPYLGYFDRLLKADIFVILDNVQFVRRAWMNRDKIKTREGEQWITVRTKKAPVDAKINQIMLTKDIDWRKKHLNLFYANYGKADYYEEILPYLEALYSVKCERMVDFNLKSIEMLMRLFDIQVDMVLASDLEPKGQNNTLNIDIMQKLGANKYLSGVGARAYHDQSLYDAAQIEVIWQDFQHPVYKQQFGEFIPYLSSIDLLLNCGIDEARKVIRG